jgi:predicted O-linked N-acetylglucosamine transferase (SPINDLY family)
MTIDQAIRIAVEHHRAARFSEAEGIYRQIVAAYQRGLADLPDEPQLRLGLGMVWSNLGLALHQSGRTDEAITALGRAIALVPHSAEAHTNLGNALKERGRLAEAIAAYRRALELQPDFAAAQRNHGVALYEAGEGDAAIEALARAAALRPDHAPSQADLGVAHHRSGRYAEAIAAFRRVVALTPHDAAAYQNLASALIDDRRLDEAVDALHGAIKLRPDHAAAHARLGNVHREQGRLDEALACFREALRFKPDFNQAASDLLLTLHYHPDYDAQRILAEHRQWASQHAEPLARAVRPHANDRNPDRRLKVGILSPDLREHPVARLLHPLLAHWDRRQFAITIYSDVRRPDAVTARLKALADDWRETLRLNDASLAERIREDAIDILVDPTLHSPNNRILVLARKPAPVQLTLCGPPATTGLTTIDYRLTDPYLDPPGSGDGDYTEVSIRLPQGFWCYEPPEEAPDVVELPAVRAGKITFGCLNQFLKVSRPAMQLWGRILATLPTARLILQSPPGSHREVVWALFEGRGIARERVDIVAPVPRRSYFARYGELDLSLDPFPYNGHTSTLDSLWMGVPVVTLAGGTAVGRGGVSLLTNAGLPEFIAQTPERYVEIAVEWARDVTRLAALRAGLRERMRHSVLMDTRRFVADVEAALRRIWTTWCGTW